MAAWTRLGLRWSARITGLLLAGMVLLFMIGEGPPNPWNQPPRVQVEFLGMALMVAGFLAGWRWAGAGGSWPLLALSSSPRPSSSSTGGHRAVRSRYLPCPACCIC